MLYRWLTQSVISFHPIYSRCRLCRWSAMVGRSPGCGGRTFRVFDRTHLRGRQPGQARYRPAGLAELEYGPVWRLRC
jgi:hypothetical protein